MFLEAAPRPSPTTNPQLRVRKMKSSKTTAQQSLESIPNVGQAIAAKLKQLGYTAPQDLAGQDPYEMYHTLCEQETKRFDPCLLDVFIAAVSFSEGKPAKPWWKFTAQRKAELKRRARSE